LSLRTSKERTHDPIRPDGLRRRRPRHHAARRRRQCGPHRQASRGQWRAALPCPSADLARHYGARRHELVGDKQKSAPDRIITPAVVVRSWNAAFAGMAMAPRKHRFAAGAVAAATAALASYATYALRMRAMNGKHQLATGLIEDALTLSAATAAALAPFPKRLTHFTTPAKPGHSAPA
jgi:hypothetical protein